MTKTKTCTRCRVEKSESEFGKKSVNKDGLMSHCKRCDREKSKYYRQSNSESIKVRAKERRALRPELGREYKRKYLYGVSTEVFERLLEQQNGRCAICSIEADSFMVDHDHRCCSGPRSCGTCVRGLLCRRCNTGIGMFQDSVQALSSAIEYLGRNA